jgi:FMN phosphatase YigB (HAD superfamily)
MNLTHFKALILDLYGTVLDREGGIFEGLRPLIDRLNKDVTQAEALDVYNRHELAQMRDTPTLEHHNLLPVVYKRIADEWHVAAPWAECIAFGLSTRDWPIYGDAPGALQYLKKFYRLIMLSDIDTESFTRIKLELPVEFDAVFTAGNVETSMPFSSNLGSAAEMLAACHIDQAEALRIVGRRQDSHRAAIDLGLATCSILRGPAYERYSMNREGGVRADALCFDSMADFVRSHQDALRL